MIAKGVQILFFWIEASCNALNWLILFFSVLAMKITIFLLLLGLSLGEEERQTITSLLDITDDYCDGEETCFGDVIDDLIYYLTGEGYDEDLDYGTSRETILMESIDSECEGDQSCLEALFEELRERVVDDPLGIYDDEDEFEWDD